MNIHTAMVYLKQGCAVTRAGWVGKIFIKLSMADGILFPNIFLRWDDEKGSITAGFNFEVDDLASDDWELYTPTHKDFQ